MVAYAVAGALHRSFHVMYKRSPIAKQASFPSGLFIKHESNICIFAAKLQIASLSSCTRVMCLSEYTSLLLRLCLASFFNKTAPSYRLRSHSSHQQMSLCWGFLFLGQSSWGYPWASLPQGSMVPSPARPSRPRPSTLNRPEIPRGPLQKQQKGRTSQNGPKVLVSRRPSPGERGKLKSLRALLGWPPSPLGL